MKKWLLSILFWGLLGNVALAADAKVTSFPALTAPGDDDLVYCIDDPGGTPISKKCTIGAILDIHRTDATAAHAGSAIANTAAGGIAATDVQAAINELDTEKQPIDADLTALAAISSNGCLAHTGAGTAAARTITGTANQITVTNGDCSAGNPTLSIPTNPTLPGTTTGTFSGNITGNVTGNTSGTAATITGLLTSSNIPKQDVLATSDHCADAGSTDAYACNLSPAVTAYVTGTHYYFKANTINSAAASINFNSVGAATIVKLQGAINTTLVDADIRAGQWVEVVYDGTNMQMVSASGNSQALTVPGSNTFCIFNDGGSLGADAGCAYDKTTDILTLLGGLTSGNCASDCISDVIGAGVGARTYTRDTAANGSYVVSTGTKTSGDNVKFDSSGRAVRGGTSTKVFGFIMGSDTGTALGDTADQADIWANTLGQGVHITKVTCYCDGGTPTVNIQRNDGSAASILSSNLSCATSGASSTSFTSGEDAIADTHRINYITVSAGGTAKRISIFVNYTLD